jgi:hypothetical protein
MFSRSPHISQSIITYRLPIYQSAHRAEESATLGFRHTTSLRVDNSVDAHGTRTVAFWPHVRHLGICASKQERRVLRPQHASIMPPAPLLAMLRLHAYTGQILQIKYCNEIIIFFFRFSFDFDFFVS